MTPILQGILLGILNGGIYAVMASGLTLIFGVMDIINVAQGILVVLGAYFVLTVQQQLHLDPFLGLLIVMPVMFVLGYAIQKIFMRPIKQTRFITAILIMYAVSNIIEGLLNFFYSTNFQKIETWYSDATIPLGFYHLPVVYLLTFLLSVVLLGALYVLIYRTQFGASVRASMQNRTAAALIGIDVEQVSAIIFGIGIALAAAGGLAYGMTLTFNASTSYDLNPRLFSIIVLGGMGSLEGTLIASLVLGIVADITAMYLPLWSMEVYFAVLIVLLLFRPQGLFGQLKGRMQ